MRCFSRGNETGHAGLSTVHAPNLQARGARATSGRVPGREAQAPAEMKRTPGDNV